MTKIQVNKKMTEISFKTLNISNEHIEALKNINIEKPTEVQEKVIPLILEGRDIITQSKTGTGKTYAYLLPIIQKLSFTKNECLIIVPVRELALQVVDFINNLEQDHVKSFPIYGGVSIERQIKELNKGQNIIVGTPGRLLDIYNRGILKLNNIKFLVLDEADRLLDMGFLPDIKAILNSIKSKFQFMLFSATFDEKLKKLVEKYANNDMKFLNLSRDKLTVKNTKQYYYLINTYSEKYKYLKHILKDENPKSAIIFVNTKKTGNWLSNKMKTDKLNLKVGYLSGDQTQNQREKILDQFRKKYIRLLVATDVAARGLDIQNISHIINYDVPQYPENYVHRIGRTSRQNKKGTAITLCLGDQYNFLCQIEEVINKEIKQRTLRNKNNDRRTGFFL
ncbi:MAG: DEAD/DEAH box helicase [Candidatus Lokiarchaeota archaeon]|nr:DEAD/DEAH box helicase [Candidatus Lokiarchaeota archaeon]